MADRAERDTTDADEAATFLAAQVGRLRDERVAEISGQAWAVSAAPHHGSPWAVADAFWKAMRITGYRRKC